MAGVTGMSYFYNRGIEYALQKYAVSNNTRLVDVGGALGIALAPVVLSGPIYRLSTKAEGRYAKPLTDAGIETLRKKMHIPKDIVIQHIPRIPPHYAPAARTVRIPPRVLPGTLSHELGHTISRKGKLLPGALAGPRVGGLLSLAALPAAMYLDPDSTTAKALPLATTLPWLPRLAEEARASFRGYRGLRAARHGRSSLLTLLPALGTYALAATAPAATLEWIRRRRAARQGGFS